METFDLNAKPLNIPTAWKVSWNHLENRRIHPELTFESLLCLTMKPDYVLDFGWHLRDDCISYDLQINRGHFALCDVVASESFKSIDCAISRLQDWLDRLTVDEVKRAKDCADSADNS
jgi:hypothetical protein